VIEFPRLHKPCKPSKVFQNPLFQAREWQRGLKDGKYESQGDIARQCGTTQPHVSQILALLDLAPEVVEILTNLGPALERPLVSQKKLRVLTKLPPRKQKEQLKKLLATKGLYPLEVR